MWSVPSDALRWVNAVSLEAASEAVGESVAEREVRNGDGGEGTPLKLRLGSDSLRPESAVPPAPAVVEPQRGGGASGETSSMLRTTAVGVVRASFFVELDCLDDLRPSKSSKISRRSSSSAASRDTLSRL